MKPSCRVIFTDNGIKRVIVTDYGIEKIPELEFQAYLRKYGVKRKGKYTKTSQNLAEFELAKHYAILHAYEFDTCPFEEQ